MLTNPRLGAPRVSPVPATPVGLVRCSCWYVDPRWWRVLLLKYPTESMPLTFSVRISPALFFNPFNSLIHRRCLLSRFFVPLSRPCATDLDLPDGFQVHVMLSC